MKNGYLRMLPLFSTLVVTPSVAIAGGLFGDLVESIGKVTRWGELEDLGKNLDREHARIKDNVKVYGQIEEELSNAQKKLANATCASAFQIFTAAIKVNTCGGFQANDPNTEKLLNDAKVILINSGLFSQGEFSGVKIHWCKNIDADGMAADRDLIYLNSKRKDSHPVDLASLLGHEMIHIRQYERLGTDKFKCEYSRRLVECLGCQNLSHPYEREAYEFERDNKNKIVDYYNSLGTKGRFWRSLHKGDIAETPNCAVEIVSIAQSSASIIARIKGKNIEQKWKSIRFGQPFKVESPSQKCEGHLEVLNKTTVKMGLEEIDK